MPVTAEGIPYSNWSTSREAAQSIPEAYPKRKSLVLSILQNNGEHGATTDEIEVATGLLHQSASSAINSLAKDGLISDSSNRRPTRSGRNAIVWKITNP